MLNKPTFGGNEFKQAIKEQSDKVLSDIHKKQEDAKPKPMNVNIERDYNILIIMRHSRRIDQHPNFAPQLKWNEKDEYLRAYDAPICDFKLPIEKMQEIQSFIPTINITKIIMSPFLRCVQTATIIAKYLNIKNFEIDARLGENALAINRCIKHAKNKQKSNKKRNYKICNDYNDVRYLTMNQIKKIIVDIYNTDTGKDNNNDEEKNNVVENDLNIEWNHKEKAGNHLHVECVKEYKKILIQQQQSKEKHRIRNDCLMISHGQVLSDISEELCGKILTVDECGWISITHNQSVKLYSPTSIQILFDHNAVRK